MLLQATPLLKVASCSTISDVAGSIAGFCREQGSAELQTIGAGALNQAVKALVIARRFLGDQGWDLALMPAFKEIEVGCNERTAIRTLALPLRQEFADHLYRTLCPVPEPLKVASTSDSMAVRAVAGAIAGCVRESGMARVQTIGAGALNTAMKAVAIARGFLAPQGVLLIAIPAFADLKIEALERTALVTYVVAIEQEFLASFIHAVAT